MKLSHGELPGLLLATLAIGLASLTPTSARNVIVVGSPCRASDFTGLLDCREPRDPHFGAYVKQLSTEKHAGDTPGTSKH
jgi:hypothetical protein